jgi:Wiskott-Aldrich syndrome protein
MSPQLPVSGSSYLIVEGEADAKPEALVEAGRQPLTPPQPSLQLQEPARDSVGLTQPPEHAIAQQLPPTRTLPLLLPPPAYYAHAPPQIRSPLPLPPSAYHAHALPQSRPPQPPPPPARLAVCARRAGGGATQALPSTRPLPLPPARLAHAFTLPPVSSLPPPPPPPARLAEATACSSSLSSVGSGMRTLNHPATNARVINGRPPLPLSERHFHLLPPPPPVRLPQATAYHSTDTRAGSSVGKSGLTRPASAASVDKAKQQTSGPDKRSSLPYASMWFRYQ